MTKNPEIYTLDLYFQNCRKAIASYLIPYPAGVILIESGPGSTQAQLKKNLEELGYGLQDVSHVLLTHIHLDHAGAAGWLAGFGAQIYVHERGAPHLIDPTRLIASAARIYGEKMETLWGDFLAVPEKQINILLDGAEVQIGPYTFRALDTPGHANHHLVYLLDQLCFSGDVGGVRINAPGVQHLRIPMPPPEFHPPKWRSSIERLKKETITSIAPTHFGFYQDVEWHLDAVLSELDAVEKWMYDTLPLGDTIAELRAKFVSWVNTRAADFGVDPSTLDAFEKANPSGMSADGIKRYWDKYILSNPSS